METKIKKCTKCGKEMPWTLEFFSFTNYFLKTGERILESRCRSCRNKVTKEALKKRLSDIEKKQDFLLKRREYFKRGYVRDRINKRKRERAKNGDFKELYRRVHKRRQETPNIRIANVMGCRINRILKKKGASWLCFVPYSVQDLISHLEKQFTPKMSWENYGSYWHIDHIRPVSSFNMTSFECDDFKKCWALENLRPLEAIENIKKGNKMDYYNSLNGSSTV